MLLLRILSSQMLQVPLAANSDTSDPAACFKLTLEPPAGVRFICQMAGDTCQAQGTG